jgi:hypothetical protein
MKKIIIAFFLFLLNLSIIENLWAGLIINEIAPNTQKDWVELKFVEEGCKSIDISSLFVTMYYGSNEPLATEAVTLYSCDRESTPYDDRFAVIHLSVPDKSDETDVTGDLNNNKTLDIYCNNYSSSLWNSDCVVAIDSDDDPSNGGIIDFIAYSNRDGYPNKTIVGYSNKALIHNAWNSQNLDFQSSAFYIGIDGLSSVQSIIRKNNSDSNTLNDFVITKFLTPGRENIIKASSRTRKILALQNKRIFFHYNESLKLFVYEQCSLRIRIFTSTGYPVYTSELYQNLLPGMNSISFQGKFSLKKTGLYLGTIEATASGGYLFEVNKFYIIYRK